MTTSQRLTMIASLLLSFSLLVMAAGSFARHREERAHLDSLRTQLDSLTQQSAVLHARVAQLEAARADGGVATDTGVAAPH